MAFTLKTLNAFEMTRRSATAEIQATRPGHRAFVGVYPPLPDKRIGQWRVGKFEIPEDLLEKVFGEEHLVDSHLVRLNTLDEVEELLRQWNVDSSVLTRLGKATGLFSRWLSKQ